MDYTRMTQHGRWSGWIKLGERSFSFEPEKTLGARDRSWGIRPVGEPERGAPRLPWQFFWLWGPLHLPSSCLHFAISELANGERWHECAAILKEADDTGSHAIVRNARVRYELTLRSGTRHIEQARIVFEPEGQTSLTLDLQPMVHFYMAGLGYGHPQWGHGFYVGEDVVSGEVWDLATLDPTIPMHFHVQSLVRVRAGTENGIGVLEQLIIGPHQPTGLSGLFDPAP
jgi:hypothetical protein